MQLSRGLCTLVVLAVCAPGGSAGWAQSPLRLEGRLERAGSGKPVTNGRLLLIRQLATGSPPDTSRSGAAPDGTFAFDSLDPGRYVLRTFAPGFRVRSDTVMLTTPPGLRLTVSLVPQPFRLGFADRLTSSVQGHTVALAPPRHGQRRHPIPHNEGRHGS
jgi:hypothetical protein